MSSIRKMFAKWLDPSQTEKAEKAEDENKLAQQRLKNAKKDSDEYRIASLKATEAASELAKQFAAIAKLVNVKDLDDFREEYEAYIKAHEEAKKAQEKVDEEQDKKAKEAKEAQKKVDEEQDKKAKEAKEALKSIDNELEEVEEALENVATIIDQVDITNKNQDWVDNIIALTVDKKIKQLQEVIEQQDDKINELRSVVNSVITRLSQVNTVKPNEKIIWDSQSVHDAITNATDKNNKTPSDIKRETRISIKHEQSELYENINEAIDVNESRP
jgi:hypothetical protein